MTRHWSASETALVIDVRYRWIQSGDPATYTFESWSGRSVGQLRVYRNVNTTNPFGTATTWTGASTGTFATAPSLTTTSANNLVLGIQAVRSLRDVPNFTGPTGTAGTDVADLVNPSPGNNSVSGRAGHIQQAAAGATGDSTISHVSKSSDSACRCRCC